MARKRKQEKLNILEKQILDILAEHPEGITIFDLAGEYFPNISTDKLSGALLVLELMHKARQLPYDRSLGLVLGKKFELMKSNTHASKLMAKNAMGPIEERYRDGEVTVEQWFERDRAFIGIQEVDTGEYIAEWWDEDVAQLFEDGFFEKGRRFEQSVVEYADSLAMPAYSELALQILTAHFIISRKEGDIEGAKIIQKRMKELAPKKWRKAAMQFGDPDDPKQRAEVHEAAMRVIGATPPETFMAILGEEA